MGTFPCADEFLILIFNFNHKEARLRHRDTIIERPRSTTVNWLTDFLDLSLKWKERHAARW